MSYGYMYAYAAQMMAALEPCTDNMTLWGDDIIDAVYTNKIEGGDDVALKSSNAILFNGVDNFFSLNDYVGDLVGMSTGFISVNHKSTADVSGLGYAIISASVITTTESSLLFVGNATGAVTGECLTFLTSNLSMYLKLGSNYLNDGVSRNIGIIIDGINNRFVIDDIEYDEASGVVEFDIGNKETESFFNGTWTNFELGSRTISSQRGLYANMTIWGLNFNDIIDAPLSENGYLFNNIDNTSYLPGGDFSLQNDTQDDLHLNITEGFSSYVNSSTRCITGEPILYTDKVELTGKILSFSNVGTSEIFDLGLIGALKGFRFASVNGELRMYYYNGTNEMFSLGNILVKNEMIDFSFTYESGSFTLVYNGVTYARTTSLTAWTDLSTTQFMIGGVNQNMFDLELKVNDVKKNTYFVRAKDEIFDVFDQRLTNPAFEIAGSEYTINLIGQSNMEQSKSIYFSMTNPKYFYDFPNIKIYEKSGEWENLSLGKQSFMVRTGFVGIEYLLGTELEKLNKQVNIYKLTEGETDTVDWLAGLWSDYITNLVLSGKMPETLIIAQGESNTASQELADRFYDDWVTMLSELNTLSPSTRVIFWLLSNGQTGLDETRRLQVNSDINLLKTNGFVDTVIDTDNQPMFDNQHYTFEGVENIGQFCLDDIIDAHGTKMKLSAGDSVIGHNGAETKLDLTSYGYGVLSYDEIITHPDLGGKIWFNRVVNGITDLGIYSVAPTGDCLFETATYYNAVVTYNGENITYNGDVVTNLKTPV